MNPRITKYGEARHILKLQDHAIHKMKNVNYTGVRFEGGQWKLHIGVTKRLSEHDKLLNPVINFSGLPLIFDEIGEIKALAADRTIKRRPAPPGVSIGHKDITAGTLGVTCFKDGTKYILSNNHVLANMNAGVIGDAILQPGAYDGGVDPADKIGTLAAFIPIVFNDQNNPNYVDCAIALPTNAEDLLDEILELGDPVSSKAAVVGMHVIKSGRTTAVNIGTITEFSGLIAVDYGSGTAYFDDQIIMGPMLLGGDSGSCLLDALDHVAVGLCFAGSPSLSVANRMTEVMAALGITIFQGVYAPSPELPLFGVPAILTLRPNRDAMFGLLSTGTPHYAQVDEETQNGDTDYVWMDGSYSYMGDNFGFSGHTKEEGFIEKVVLIVYAKATGAYDTDHWALIVNGIEFSPSPGSLPLSNEYLKYSYELTTDPRDRLGYPVIPWTWARIDSVTAGVKLWPKWGTDEKAYVTQLYLEVYYTPILVPVVHSLPWVGKFQLTHVTA